MTTRLFLILLKWPIHMALQSLRGKKWLQTREHEIVVNQVTANKVEMIRYSEKEQHIALGEHRNQESHAQKPAMLGRGRN